MNRLELEVVDPGDGHWRHDIIDLSVHLRNADAGLRQRMFVKDASGAGMDQLAEMSVVVVPSVITAFTTWFVARAGRKARLKIGDVEAEASNIEDVKKLLEIADERAKKLTSNADKGL